MKIEIDLKNPTECMGCPYFNNDWCSHYGELVNISNSTGLEIIPKRLQKCIEENGL